jgi:hypothetical protein
MLLVVVLLQLVYAKSIGEWLRDVTRVTKGPALVNSTHPTFSQNTPDIRS